jgi:hypothetical protein
MVALVTAGLLLSLTGRAQEGDPDKKKLPVPSAEDQAKAEKVIKGIFKDEYKLAAKEAEAKVKLAAEFLKNAAETTEDAPARYVLLREAYDLAARGGDVPLAFAAAEEMERTFLINPLSVRVEILTLLGPAAVAREDHTLVAEIALDLIDEALLADNFEAAEKLVQTADSAAAKAKSLPLLALVKQRGPEVQSLAKAHERFREFVIRLKKNAKDPQANLEAGKYLGLARGDWDRALPYLAQGSDKALKELAQQDLAKPQTLKQRIEQGDRWWNLAEKEKGKARDQLRLRAAFWYEQVLPEVSGISATRLRKCLEQTPRRTQGAGLAAVSPGKIGEIRRLAGHTDGVIAVTLSADGRQALSGSWAGGKDTTVRWWDVRSGKELRCLEGHTAGVTCVAFSPLGKRALSGSLDTTIRLWNLETGKVLKSIPAGETGLFAVVFSADGKHAYSSSHDTLIRFWDLETGKELQQLKGHANSIRTLALSPDGKRLLSGSFDNTLKLWDAKTGQEIRTFAGHATSIVSVAFSPDGKRAVSGSYDKTVRVWDLESGKELKRFEGDLGEIHGVAFSPDGRRVASASLDRTVRVWDVESGKELKRFEGHTDLALSVAFTPDSRYVLSGSYDGTLRLWRLPR